MLTSDGDQNAEHAHHQERAHAGQIALGGIAPQAHRAESRGGDEKGARDAGIGKDQEDRPHRQTHRAAETARTGFSAPRATDRVACGNSSP